MESLLFQTLDDLASRLRQHKIPFALIGGMAVAARGFMRMTRDVDVIAANVLASEELLRRLSEEPFEPNAPDPMEVLEVGMMIPLVHRPTGVTVDVTLAFHGFEQQLIERACPIENSGVDVPVATAEDLMLMKIIANRPQDDKDVLLFARSTVDQLNWDYLMTTGRDLQAEIAVDILPTLRRLREQADAG